MKDRERVRIKWKVIERHGDVRALGEGLALALVSVIAVSIYLGCCVGAVFCLEDRPKFEPVAAWLFLATPLKGLVLGQWIRRVHSRADSVVHPFLTRLGIWIAFFLVVGIAARFILGLSGIWSSLHDTQSYIAIVIIALMAFGAVQFQVMLRMPEILRSADPEDGAIL